MISWIIFIIIISSFVVLISIPYKKNTNWEKMAYHDCGYLIDHIPHGNINFLTDFIKLCPKCGKQYKYSSMKVFTGRWNDDKLEKLATEEQGR